LNSVVDSTWPCLICFWAKCFGHLTLDFNFSFWILQSTFY
jgi:hypothetical protein